MSTPTIDISTDIDLESMLDQPVVCETHDCDTPATHRMSLVIPVCGHRYTYLFCAPHVEYWRMHFGSAVLWQCTRCFKAGPAGDIVVATL